MLLALTLLTTAALPGISHAADRKVAINFGLTYVPVGNSPVFTVPKSMGFWKEEGLDCNIVESNYQDEP
jgi:ABC-type nitrate/sulfonate/bicarbonate transport system substrate-binding protein